MRLGKAGVLRARPIVATDQCFGSSTVDEQLVRREREERRLENYADRITVPVQSSTVTVIGPTMFAYPILSRYSFAKLPAILCQLAAILADRPRLHSGVPSGRLTNSNMATWVFSNQDSSVSPQTVQFA